MATDDLDIGVTKAAPSLLADIQRLLKDLEKNPPDCNRLSDHLRRALDPFQEAPELLDPILESVISRLSNVILESIQSEINDSNQWPFDILYTLCKVRGYKTVCQFLPPHVSLLEDILIALDGRVMDEASEEQELTESNHSFSPITWQQRYCLLLWLSILVLAPFELGTFGPSIQNRLYKVSRKYISVPGKERDAAILVMSRLITRSDTIDSLLPTFFNDILGVFSDSEIAINSNNKLVGKLGIFQTTAMIFQLATHNSKNLKLYDQYLQNILLKQDDSENDNIKTSSFDKLRVKNLGRIAIVLLSQIETNDENSDHYFEYVEEIIGQLLKFLSHKDTLVRYSTSKAIARIVHKLSDDEFRMDVIDAVLSSIDDNKEGVKEHHTIISLYFDRVAPSSWHGGLLCVAEMLRRKLLLPDIHFKRLQSILNLSLRFEQQKLTYSLGDNVRDASCYVCWSLFRVYQQIDNSIIDSLFQDLVNLACYDPEVSVRRAASAALQEGVGRQGGCQGSVETQIGLVQKIEYFRIGLRTRSYLEVALDVYRLGFKSVIDYVLGRTTCNWDPAVRRLSGESLKLLAENSHQETIELIINQLFDMYDVRDVDTRHGTVYSLGEVCSTDSPVVKSIVIKNSNIILNILNDFSEHDLKEDNEVLNCDSFLHLYRCLIQHKVIGFKRPEFIKNFTFSLELTDQNIINTIRQVMLLFQKVDEKDIIPPEVIDIWIQRMMCGKSSFAFALGFISGQQSKESLLKVFTGLIQVIKGSNEVALIDLSTRSQAVHSLGKLITLFSEVGPETYPVNDYIEALIIALNDYTIDSRGDVGSWVREAAIQECSDIYSCKLVTDSFRERIIGRLLGMSVEVLLKLRVSAIQHLKQISFDPLLDGVIKTMPENYERSAKIHYSHMTLVFDLELSPSISSQFLNSYISAAGAQHASEDTLRGSLDALVEYLRKLPNESGRLESFIDKLSGLLDIRVYGSKTVTCTLRVLSNVLESGLLLRLYSKNNQNTLVKRLYTRTFNAHINTKSLPRIFAAIEIFSGLAQLGHNDSRKRLGVLCRHTFPVVRVRAAEALREVLISLIDDIEEEDLALEAIEILEETDW